MYIWLLIAVIFETNRNVLCESIQETIGKYFESESVLSFKDDWTKHMVAFENAITNTLQDSHGYGLLNVFMTSPMDSPLLTHGFLISDNAVDVLCYDMNLTEFPRLTKPIINFALASNVLRVESPLSTVLVETDYLLFRNSSEILEDDAKQDPNVVSPFSFQQVLKTGHLAITADDCFLIGTILVPLSGSSVSFGQDTVRLADCRFTVEISSIGRGSPPVIAPYLSKEKSEELMTLLGKPLRRALLPKLQAIVLSLVVTTNLFESKLYDYRAPQQELFKATSEYLSNFVSKLNKITGEKNQGILPLKDFTIAVDEKGKLFNIHLSHITLSGMDTAYSSNHGGPYKLKHLMLSEEINFNTLNVKGQLIIETVTTSEDHEFAAELKDLSVDVVLTIVDNELKLNKILFSEMRALEFAIIEDFKQADFRHTAQAIITGYLTDQVPKVVIQYLNKVFSEDFELKTLDGSSEQTNDLVTLQQNKLNETKNDGVDKPTSELDDSSGDSNDGKFGGGQTDKGNFNLNSSGLAGGQSNLDNHNKNLSESTGGSSVENNPTQNPSGLAGGSSVVDNPNLNPSEAAGSPSDEDNPTQNPSGLAGGSSVVDNPNLNPSESVGSPSDEDNPTQNPSSAPTDVIDVNNPVDPQNQVMSEHINMPSVKETEESDAETTNENSKTNGPKKLILPKSKSDEKFKILLHNAKEAERANQ